MAKYTDNDVINAYRFFGFDSVVTRKKIRDVFEELVKEHHPDNGGDEEKMSEINSHKEVIEDFFKSHKKLGKNTRLNKAFHEIFENMESPSEIEEESEDVSMNEDAKSMDIALSEEVIDEEVPYEEVVVEAPVSQFIKTKIYINGELFGTCDNPKEFTQQMREKRRNGQISHEMNITYYEDNNEIYIFNDPGRARRPLIIVKEGQPLLTEDHLNKVANGKLKWDDLIEKGLIEYLDAEEEENSYIAMRLNDLSVDHTHLEIDPATMLGICAGIIPFSDHNSSPRNTMEAGMTKQALGLYVSNYAFRTDTRAHLLHHPQTPIVKTRIIDSTNYDLRPSGQNFVVALMSYEGYNMEDAMVINKGSLERGLGRSSFFNKSEFSELNELLLIIFSFGKC